MGALGFQFVSAEMAHAWVHAYYNAFVKRQEKLADYQTNANIALVSGFMCCGSDEEALRKADGWTFFQFALRFYATRSPVAPGEVDLWQEYQGWKETPQGQKARRGGLVGSPETVRQKLRKFEASQIDQVILLNQAGNNSHEDICASLELFARQVMPEFQGREPEHQGWKRAVLSGELELEEVDTAAHAFARPTLRSEPEAGPQGRAAKRERPKAPFS
jgi:alkanesulfonate monooxygenase SsuD/methylene tetrahydromethanopterin reductase-like flavin-dependent oxidoreductase (luciferase family)